MKLSEIFLDQLGREVPLTRHVLERIPEGRDDWKPHPRSMTLGYLATLLAIMPGWATSIVLKDELDIAPPGVVSAAQTSTSDLVTVFDRNVAELRGALTGATDEQLMKPWRLLAGGHVVSEEPKHVMIRDSVFGHLAHHRGQMTVYLRLNDIAVPQIYGPTADEKWG